MPNSAFLSRSRMFIGKGAKESMPLLAELKGYFGSYRSINLSFLRNWFSVGSAVVLTLSLMGPVSATQLARSLPAAANVSSQRLAQMDPIVEQAIAQQQLPGAVVLVGRRGRVVWEKAYGARVVDP